MPPDNEIYPSTTPQSPPVSLPSNKLPLFVIMVSIVTAFLLGGIGVYFLMKNTVTQIASNPPTPSQTTSDPTLGWVNFASEKTRLIFKHPQDYTLTENNPRTTETGYWYISVMSPLAEHNLKDTLVNNKELKIEVSIEPLEPNETLESYYASQRDHDDKPLSTPVETSLGGVKALKHSWTGLGNGITYFLIYGNSKFAIVKYPQNTDRDPEFDLIFNSIAFTPETSITTSSAPTTSSPTPKPQLVISYSLPSSWQTTSVVEGLYSLGYDSNLWRPVCPEYNSRNCKLVLKSDENFNVFVFTDTYAGEPISTQLESRFGKVHDPFIITDFSGLNAVSTVFRLPSEAGGNKFIVGIIKNKTLIIFQTNLLATISGKTSGLDQSYISKLLGAFLVNN